jgi:hypothetical protein
VKLSFTERDRRRRWALTHPDQVRLANKRWRELNPDRARRQARERMRRMRARIKKIAGSRIVSA